jgi:hypothetical protein
MAAAICCADPLIHAKQVFFNSSKTFLKKRITAGHPQSGNRGNCPFEFCFFLNPSAALAHGVPDILSRFNNPSAAQEQS